MLLILAPPRSDLRVSSSISFQNTTPTLSTYWKWVFSLKKRSLLKRLISERNNAKYNKYKMIFLNTVVHFFLVNAKLIEVYIQSNLFIADMLYNEHLVITDTF